MLIGKPTQGIQRYHFKPSSITTNLGFGSHFCHITMVAFTIFRDYDSGYEEICLCLLDLSAAFDTIDHNISLTRLSSWFGIQGTALNWFRSYLSSRCFRVKCNNNLSSLHTVVSTKAQFLALYSLSCIQPHSVF